MSKVQEGDKVTVVYQAVLEDGSTFDASDDDAPLTFVIGEDEVLPGFERSILGMEIGERKVVALPPEDAYGVRKEHLVEEVDIDALPKDIDLSIGNQLEVTAEDGSTFRLQVVQRSSQTVTLDANHPLAGQTLTFQIEVLDIHRPTLN